MSCTACLVGWIFGLTAAPAAATEMATQLRAEIEADYIARDRQRGRPLPWQASASAAVAAPPSEPFCLAHIREVVDNARRLLRCGPSDPTVAARLERLAEAIAQAEASAPSETSRRAWYLEACWLRRAAALAGVALDAPLLFVKRHAAKGVFHMCDQFYGFNAVAGGGLYVLERGLQFNPIVFPDRGPPVLVDLLAGAAVESGRLAGQRLVGGAALSPEVSFDGRTIYFAYTEAKGKNLEWSPAASYHLFSIGSDGRGLRQLTDGDGNDFDPCVLPGGRVAFISERRGGYLRCGRHCPTYTLFSMAADGSDIRCLSFHETHEWQPSVTHEGLIAYTRWDYVDRDTNVAHHIWTCYPDGRDPRSFHGNYPRQRESRPWMEMDIRAVPGSHAFVATAAAHHGHAFGSLVLIDPRKPDDGAMSQLVRLTPEVPFPEAEGGKSMICRLMVYGTPWPLGGGQFLCAYDLAARNHGLCWIDSAGHRELIYRDPTIASISPMPLARRAMPPALPDQTAPPAAATARKATVAVMNVYDSDFAWPDDTRIARLRIIQALPKTTPPPNEPRIGVADQTNARAVLGSVPVEADGSAYFEAPVGKAIYFQAIDDAGMAVQSMRSATYVHPGEQLVCRGCHEPKHQPAPVAAAPRALTRPPSPIEPDVDGSNPFSYVRLVQPVLDRHCVGCHRERKAVDLGGAMVSKHGWSQSYQALAKQYGFYYNVSNGSIRQADRGGSRTEAGRFGARGSKLLPYLSERHHGVKLSAEDFHRVTLWLDANSEFFGSYEQTAAQSRGEVVRPTLD